MDRLIVFFIMILILLSIGMIGSAIYLLVRYTQLGYYVRKAKYDRWAELTTDARSGMRVWNSMLGLRYIYGADDNEDPIIARLKGRIRIGIRQGLAMLLGSLVVLGILLLLTHFD